jgi:hypothetical protein
MGGNVLHDLAHAVFLLSKISHSTKPTVIMHFSTTAAFWLWPTVFEMKFTGTISTLNLPSRLGNPIFGSDFWDPHQKRNSDSVFDSKDSII